MSRKLVAIGGGENARLKADGSRYPYETGPMDKEIIRLTGKSSPHFLFIAHAQKPDGEQRYYETMKYIYKNMGYLGKVRRHFSLFRQLRA